MTQNTAPASFATRDEVAALIGVMPDTLPKGVAMVEPCIVEYSTVSDAYHQIYSHKTNATAYTWRDDEGRTIVDVRVDGQASGLMYQKNDYDQNGIKTAAHEQLKSGKVNKMTFHANGQVRHAAYGTTYGYDDAVLHKRYDEHGKLHNPAGYATFIKSRFVHEEAYYIHGTQYEKPEFEQHPERIAYLRENRIDKGIASAFGRVFNAVSRMIAGGDAAPREGVLKVDQLVAIAEQLSEADKLKLLRAITDNAEKASADSNLDAAVEGATVRITAPSVSRISRRPTTR